MKQRVLIAFVFLLQAPLVVLAQGKGEMTLQQCIHYGLTHSLTMQRGKLDVQRTNYVRSEAMSGYLPQVNGSANVVDNLKLQTSILPGEIFGQPGKQIPVRFGTKYNVATGIDASQLLFNQQLIYALKAAKENQRLAELNIIKASNQLTYDIASAFYAAQVTKTQTQLIAANVKQLDSLLLITTIQLENGFAKQLDVDRLKVNLANLMTDKENAESGYAQQMELLKFLMGMPDNENLSIASISVESVKPRLKEAGNIQSVDLDLLVGQRNLQELNVRQLKGSHIPVVAMNFKYAYQLLQDNLNVFSKNANWFPNSYVGLNVQIPIFDGFAVRSKVKQTQIQIDQNRIDEQQLRASLGMQQTNAKLKLKTNVANLDTRLRNIALAQSVFEATRVQYAGGIATMSDLLNAETALSDAQTNYLSSLIQVKIAELELLKINGSITDITQ